MRARLCACVHACVRACVRARACLSPETFCRDKHTFITCLSRQKLYLWQLPPMILVWFSATYITKMTVRLADADFQETLRDTHSEDFKQLASSLKTPVSGIQTVFNPFTATRTTPSLKRNQPTQQSQKIEILKACFSPLQ